MKIKEYQHGDEQNCYNCKHCNKDKKRGICANCKGWDWQWEAYVKTRVLQSN